jgi:sigma-E factor negative regulatory protein RseC
MYEHAVVVASGTNRKITVTCSTSSCGECHAGAFCSAKGKTFIAKNTHDLKLHKGDEIELYLPPGKTLFAGFITLLVPLILFPVGYFLPNALAQEPKELTRILAGFAGIIIGFIISGIFSRVKANEYMPNITRIIEKEAE